jgi:uncharacterized protein
MPHAPESVRHAIRRLDLVVTEACNLACPYCFARGGGRGSMSREVAWHAVRWLLGSDAERLHITFWGGEPLLRLPLLREVTAEARREAAAAGKALTLSLPTNATLLSDDALGWIEENGVRVFLSIDGDEETQRDRPLAAGGSSHALAARGLDLALRRGRAPAVRLTVTPANVGQLAHNVAYFWDRGVREVLSYAALDGVWPAAALDSFAAQQQRLAEELTTRLRAVDPRQAPVLRAWRGVLRRLLLGGPPRSRAGALRDCGAGRELIAVGIDGRFSACHRFVFYTRGRDARGPGDLDEPLLEELRPFKELRVEDLRGAGGRCVDCEIFELCTYGCVAINYATSGQLTGVPATACALQRAQVAACVALHEQLRGDPRYALYLGRSLADSAKEVARMLGTRAWQLYHRR